MRPTLVIVLAVALSACGTETGTVTDTSTITPVTPVETSAPTTTRPETVDPPSITVGGKGTAFDTPDRCVVTLGVSTRRPTVAEAGEAASDSGRALVDALVDRGIPRSDIQMSEFSISPYYGVAWEEFPQIEGYQADFGYRVVLGDTESVGELLGAAIAAGGDDARAWGISFETDPEGLIDTARIAAWQDAESRAAALSELIGRPLGSVLDVHEKVLTTTSSGVFAAGEGDTAQFDIPVAPGVAGVIVLLTVTYELG